VFELALSHEEGLGEATSKIFVSELSDVDANKRSDACALLLVQFPTALPREDVLFYSPVCDLPLRANEMWFSGQRKIRISHWKWKTIHHTLCCGQVLQQIISLDHIL
jgi:hypothetical protein